MADLPSGTVTFLFTDIDGSTRLLTQLGQHYSNVLSAHRLWTISRRRSATHMRGRRRDRFPRRPPNVVPSPRTVSPRPTSVGSRRRRVPGEPADRIIGGPTVRLSTTEDGEGDGALPI
jgi:hypothetical protein